MGPQTQISQKQLQMCIKLFLHCGYLPGYDKVFGNHDFDNTYLTTLNLIVENLSERKETIDTRQAKVEFLSLMKQSVSRELERTNSKPIILPLSGGLDSRAILAILLELGAGDLITTVTFGMPGTFDYEIGRQVAKVAETKHVSIDLTQENVNQSSMEEFSKTTEGWHFIFDAWYNRLIPERFGSNVVYWSGFLGGELGGSHVPENEARDWSTSIDKFLCTNAFDLGWGQLRLTPEEKISFFGVPHCDPNIMSYADQLDFFERQRWLILNNVTDRKHDYALPFLDSELFSFFISLPLSERRGCNFYHKALQNIGSPLFDLPCTNFKGYPLGGSALKIFLKRLALGLDFRLRYYLPFYRFGASKNSNHVGFYQVLHTRKDYQKLAFDNISDLKMRGYFDFCDVDKLWQSRKRGDIGLQLLLMSCLEIKLKHQELIVKT